MANERKPKTGLLGRRSDRKRQKAAQRAERASNRQREQSAAAERQTHGWEPSVGP